MPAFAVLLLTQVPESVEVDWRLPTAALHLRAPDRRRISCQTFQQVFRPHSIAHESKHDRPVALKLVHPALAAILGPERFAPS